jgi:hypothetical protein
MGKGVEVEISQLREYIDHECRSVESNRNTEREKKHMDAGRETQSERSATAQIA